MFVEIVILWQILHGGGGNTKYCTILSIVLYSVQYFANTGEEAYKGCVGGKLG